MADEAALSGNNLFHLAFAYGDRMRSIDRTATRNPAIRRSLEGGRLSIPHVETQDGAVICKETVFAGLLGRKMQEASMNPRRDDVQVTHVPFKVRNTGTADGQARGHPTA